MYQQLLFSKGGIPMTNNIDTLLESLNNITAESEALLENNSSKSIGERILKLQTSIMSSLNTSNI